MRLCLTALLEGAGGIHMSTAWSPCDQHMTHWGHPAQLRHGSVYTRRPHQGTSICSDAHGRQGTAFNHLIPPFSGPCPNGN